MNVAFDKKKVRALAREMIKQGKSKQEVYDELVKQFYFRNEIADIVVEIPSNERWKSYGILNTLTLVFLLLLVIASLYTQQYISIIFPGLLAWLVFTKKFSRYFWLMLFGGISALSIIVIFIFASGEFDTISLLISLGGSALLFMAGYALPRMLTPEYQEVKEFYINDQGKKKIRLVHRFVE